MVAMLSSDVISYDIKTEAGGVSLSGSLTLPLFDAIFFESGDVSEIYVGDVRFSEVLLSTLNEQGSSYKYDVVSTDIKYLKRFIVDDVRDSTVYSYYVDVGSFDLYWLDNSETATANLNTWVVLSKRYLKPNSEVVTSSDGTTTYVKDTDYTVDYENGRIYVLGTGSIADGSTINISYKYYEDVDIVDLVKYVVDKYVKLPYHVDDFEILDSDGNRIRLTHYTINDYALNSLKRLANVVGARFFVSGGELYFLVSTYKEVSGTYSNDVVVFDKWTYDPKRLVNDVHVFGKDITNEQIDTFAGDGVNKIFVMSKMPNVVKEVEINISGEWTKVPYNDPNTGELRYNWSTDYEKSEIIFDEAPPVSPAISDPILQSYPEWTYMNKITISNPNAVDVNLTGKIVIDNSSTESNAINDFKWGAVKDDGSDIVIAYVDANGNIVEIPYKFFSWSYGNSAEIWFGGAVGLDPVFTVPANGSVDVYLLYGNPNATRSYTWDDVKIDVFVDTTGKFKDVDYTAMLYVDTSATTNADAEFSYDSLSDTFRAYTSVEGYNDETATVDAYTDLLSGEFYIYCEGYITSYDSNFDLGISIWKRDGSGTYTWTKSRFYGTSGIVDNGLETVFTEYVVYSVNEAFGVSAKSEKYSSTSYDYAKAYVEIKYWIRRHDGDSPCTYVVNPVVENLYNNVKVTYAYSAPLYYNKQNGVSIGKYGIRSRNITLNWVTDREALSLYGDKYIEAFSNPLYFGKFKMGIGKYVDGMFYVGDVINVDDRHGGVSGKFIVDKLRISNGKVIADVIQIPDISPSIIGLLNGTVLFDVDQSERIRTLEVGKYSNIINIL